MIIEGSGLPSGSTGFVLNTSHSTLRGLAIDGFSVGVSIPNPTNVGDLIQGNFIGVYDTYLVDAQTGAPVSTDPVGIAGVGNADQGVLLGSANATVGGTDPQDDNVIIGNGAQGVLIEPGASGNQVLGNQIGVLGPVEGFYFQLGNGAEGVLIESTSNVIGRRRGQRDFGEPGDGVHIEGVGATRNLVEANYIGAAPGGGYIFGSGDPGNGGDGVLIDDAPDNQVGGGSASDGNVISSNGGNGVNITGAAATGNTY